MLIKAILGDLERKIFFISNCGGQHLRSVLQLFSLLKLTNYFWKVKLNPVVYISLDSHRYVTSYSSNRFNQNLILQMLKNEVQNSQARKLSYETVLCKMTSRFELHTQKCLLKFCFWVPNSTLQNIKLSLELLTWDINFYFFTFELLTWSQKIKS